MPQNPILIIKASKIVPQKDSTTASIEGFMRQTQAGVR